MGSGMAQLFVPRLFKDAAAVEAVRLRILTAPTKYIFNDLYEERIDAGIAIESDPERIPSGIVVDRLIEAEMALNRASQSSFGKGETPSPSRSSRRIACS
jgi:DNA-binding transcriptional LysR family regulator